MKYYYGKAASNGIAFGKIIELIKKEKMVSRFHISNEEEIERFLTAKDEAIIELDKLYQKALNEVGEANASIFQVHQMMMEDSDYIDSVINIISVQKINSEFAVAETSKNFAEMFSNMDNDYMKERAADIKDISERLIAILEQRNGLNVLNETCIVVADDLVPSETVQR